MSEVYGFIEENLTRFAQLNLNTTMIFYGAKGAGKTTFLFQTSFFNMLTDQLAASNGQSEGLGGLNGAWLQAYEIGIDSRTRVEKKVNLLNFNDSDNQSGNFSATKTSTRGQMVHKSQNRNADRETFIELELTEDGNMIQPH